MDSLLTSGALGKIMNGVKVSPGFTPMMQIIGLKEMMAKDLKRYRILISDGVKSLSTGMLGPDLTPLVENGQIGQYCIVKVTNCHIPASAAERTGKTVVIFNEVTVIKTGSDVGGKLGNPEPYKHEAQTPMAAVENIREGKTTGSSFYGNNKPQPKAMPQTSGTPGTPGGGPVKIYPIANITPYQNRWTIKARVTQKSNVRTYSNSRGEGKFFNCIFSDESGEIKATAWKTECDQFFDTVELNKVYQVTKAQLKTANKQFSNTNNDYEMNITPETRITLCDENEASSVPSMQFSFVNISELNEHAVGKLIDVCGVAHQIADATTIIARSSQREMTKRDIELVDDSMWSVRLTIWGDEAKNFPADGHPVLVVKGAKIGDWNGRSLGLLSSSQLIQNPDNSDAHRLRGWYDSEGECASFTSYAGESGSMASGASGKTEWKTLSCIKTENLGRGDKPDWFTVKGMLTHIKKDNCLYQACSSDGCNKKVVDNMDGTYRCEKCNKTMSDFKPRMLLQCNVSDHTESTWVTAFQDSGEKILGKSAQELLELRDADSDDYHNTFKNALYMPLQLTIRSKCEMYNDEARLKSVCTSVKDVEMKVYNTHLLEQCKKLLSTMN